MHERSHQLSKRFDQQECTEEHSWVFSCSKDLRQAMASDATTLACMTDCTNTVHAFRRAVHKKS